MLSSLLSWCLPLVGLNMRENFDLCIFQVNINNCSCFIISRTGAETYRLRGSCSELLSTSSPAWQGWALCLQPDQVCCHQRCVPFLLFCTDQLLFQYLKNAPRLMWWINQLLRGRGKTHCINHWAGSPGKLEFRKDARMWAESQSNLNHIF